MTEVDNFTSLNSSIGMAFSGDVAFRLINVSMMIRAAVLRTLLSRFAILTSSSSYFLLLPASFL